MSFLQPLHNHSESIKAAEALRQSLVAYHDSIDKLMEDYLSRAVGPSKYVALSEFLSQKV